MNNDPFDLLHPAVAHHIVNSLGWRSLRPLQSAAIEPILAGDHAIAMAPTAGGKPRPRSSRCCPACSPTTGAA